MRAIFLSDVHLRDAASVKSKLVIRFLQEVASQFEHIYVLGDLFDVWPGTNAYLVRAFRPVIQVLKGLVEDGHQIHYIEGNHDFHLGEYFTENLGIQVHPDSITETWNGKRIYMAHGDLGNPKEFGYRLLRHVLRRELTRNAIASLPSEWVYRVGLRSSQFSRKYQSKLPKRDELIKGVYRKAAEDIFKRGYDIVLMGHTHLPDDVSIQLDGRERRYINIGDWVSNFTYLEFDGLQFYTRTHPVKSL